MKNRILPLLFLFFITACNSVSSEETETGIYGTWVFKEYKDDHLVLERSKELPADNYGITIKKDHTLTERNILGWCATPPVMYTNYEGKWSAESDSQLNISVDGYWNGTSHYKMEILSVNAYQLIIRKDFSN